MDKKTMIALVAAAVMGISGSAFAYHGPDVDIDDAAAAQTGGVAAGDDVSQYDTDVDIDAAAAQTGGVAAGDDATSIEVEKKDVDIASNNRTDTDIDVDKDVDIEKNMLSNNDTDVDVEKNMLSNNDTDVDTDFMSNNEWKQDNSINTDVKFDDLSLGLAFASKGSIALAAGGDMDVDAAIAENDSKQTNDFSGLQDITVRNGVQDKVTTEETEGYRTRCGYVPGTTTETVIPGSSMAAVTARMDDVNIGSGIGMNINGAFVQATNSASALAINGNSNLTSGNQ